MVHLGVSCEFMAMLWAGYPDESEALSFKVSDCGLRIAKLILFNSQFAIRNPQLVPRTRHQDPDKTSGSAGYTFLGGLVTTFCFSSSKYSIWPLR
jgi:hypothetical protein